MSRVHPFFFAISGKSLVCRRPLLFASMMPKPFATVFLCFLAYLCFLRRTLGRLGAYVFNTFNTVDNPPDKDYHEIMT